MTPALLLLPDFALIALGAALKRTPWFDAAFWRGVERIVYFVLFPALLFRALATSSLAPGDASKLIAVGILFTAAGMAASIIVRPLLRLPSERHASILGPARMAFCDLHPPRARAAHHRPDRPILAPGRV